MQHQVAQAVSSIAEKGINIDPAKMAGPTSTSNWLLPGLILVGDYPKGAKLAKLISAGVVHFVDLRSNGEDYLAASGEHDLLYTHFELQKRVSSIHAADITETALTLKGILASCILNNSIAYLHCTDGHNLTAIAMAGILAFVYGVSGMKATQVAAQLHGTRRDNDGVHQLFTANQRAFVKDLSTDSNSYPTHMFAPTGAGGALQQVSQPNTTGTAGSSPTSGGSPNYAQRGAPAQMDAGQLLYGAGRPGTSQTDGGGAGSQAPTPSRTPNSSRFEHTRGHGGGYTSINIFGGSDSSAADSTPTRKKGRAAVPGMTPEYPHHKTGTTPSNATNTSSAGNSPVRNHPDHQHHPTNSGSGISAATSHHHHQDPSAQNLGQQLDSSVGGVGNTPTHVTPQRSASVQQQQQQQQQQPPQDTEEADMPPPLGTYNSASHYGTSGLFTTTNASSSSNAPSPMTQQQQSFNNNNSSSSNGVPVTTGGEPPMMGDRLASEEQVQLPPHIVPTIIDVKSEGKEVARGPSATTNWVVRDQVLIGPSPNPDHKDFRYLVQQRFDTFVVLTEENVAMQYVPYYEQRARVRCDALHHPMKDGEPVSGSQTQSFLSFIAELVERVRVGEKLYIHCQQGHGRSGMVAAALLAELYGLNGMKAVNLNSALHDCRDDTEDRESPDNQDQRLSIISLFS